MGPDERLRLIKRTRHTGLRDHERYRAYLDALAAFVLLREHEWQLASTSQADPLLKVGTLPQWAAVLDASPADLPLIVLAVRQACLDLRMPEGQAPPDPPDPARLPPSLLEAAREAADNLRPGPCPTRVALHTEFVSLLACWAEAVPYSLEFSLPGMVCQMAAGLVDVPADGCIYDPCAGIGSLLDRAAPNERRPDSAQPQAAGLDPRADLLPLCTARLLLAGVKAPRLFARDARVPFATPESTEFDCIVAACPPAPEPTSLDELSSDARFVDHALSALREDGTAAILVADAFLTRRGADAKVRRRLLSEFRLEAVVAFTGRVGLLGRSLIVFSRRTPAIGVWLETSVSHSSGPVVWHGPLPVPIVVLGDSAEERALRALRRWVDAVRSNDFRSLARDMEAEFSRDTAVLGDAWPPKGTSPRPAGEEDAGIFALLDARELAWEARHALREVGKQPARAWPLCDFLSQGAFNDHSEGARRRAPLRLEPIDVEGWVAQRVGQAGDLVGVALSEVCTVFRPRRCSGANWSDALGERGAAISLEDAARGKTPAPAPASAGTSLDPREAAEARGPAPQLGDVLLAASEDAVGVGSVDSSLHGATADASLVVLRPHDPALSPHLVVALRQGPYQEWLRYRAVVSPTGRVPLREIARLPVPVPRDPSRPTAPDTGASDSNPRMLSGPACETLLVTPYSAWERDAWWRALAAWQPSESDWAAVGQRLAQLPEEWDRDVGESAVQDLLAACERLRASRLVPQGVDRAFLVAAGCYLREFDDEGRDCLLEEFKPLRQAVRSVSLYETGEVLRDVELTVHTSSLRIPVGHQCDVSLTLRNSGSVTMRKVEVRCGNQSTHFPCMVAGETRDWLAPVAASSPGPVPLDIEWSALTLHDEEVGGTVCLTLEAKKPDESNLATDLGASPYSTGNPVGNGEGAGMFFGREDVLRQLKLGLHRDSPDRVILLEGNRRVGKTSLLRRLEAPGFLDGWLPVYSSLQGVEGDRDRAGIRPDALFYDMATKVVLAGHAAAAPVTLPSGCRISPDDGRLNVIVRLRDVLRPDFTSDPFQAFTAVLQAVADAVRPMRILLMVDEFEKLQEGIDTGVTPAHIPENLRFLFQDTSFLSGILAGSRRMSRMRQSYFGPLFGIGQRIELGALDDAASLALVERPIQGRIEYEELAKRHVVDLCGHQPYLIQCLCHRLFLLCASTGARIVGRRDVVAEADALVDGFEHFRALWDDLGSDRLRYLLCLVDQLGEDDDREPVSFDRLFRSLRRQGLGSLRPSGLRADLERLRDLGVLSLTGGFFQSGYGLSVPLLSRWLRKNVDSEIFRQCAIADTRDA
jgi:hypothetical protein